ncbi:MAG: hypothetical protein ABR540_17990 [Acidimicrobiales bacterium]
MTKPKSPSQSREVRAKSTTSPMMARASSLAWPGEASEVDGPDTAGSSSSAQAASTAGAAAPSSPNPTPRRETQPRNSLRLWLAADTIDDPSTRGPPPLSTDGSGTRRVVRFIPCGEGGR